ncbi:MAG: hypothetical protein Q4D58_05850 [Synergistaceae bacterium]|nr:hypothetical protein [Synergistaceae bacterium]
MQSLFKNLYQFSAYIPPMDFTIHQYLLAAEPSILFAAGTSAQAEAALPRIKEILQGRELKYIFVSHIESDECGGISVFQKAYPELQVICSNFGARELPGYGYTGKLLPVSAEKQIKDGDLDLQFFDYPSEAHLQNGLVCFERKSGIFYSSDLMLRFGNGANRLISGKWKDEVAAVGLDRIPSAAALEKLKADLITVKPSFIAVGHGFCVACEE